MMCMDGEGDVVAFLIRIPLLCVLMLVENGFEQNLLVFDEASQAGLLYLHLATWSIAE